MPRLLRLFAPLLLVCGLVQPVRAQQAPTFVDLQGIWGAALRVAGEPLVLPAAQRGIQFCRTFAYYQGQHYLLQRLHYDRQGRLDTVSAYYLDRQDGQLQSRLTHQTLYHTKVLGDSLVSQVETLYPTPTGSLITSPRLLSGTIPPVEPLLGEGAAANQALLPRLGHLREVDQRPEFNSATNNWQWGIDAQGQRATLLFHSPAGAGSYSQHAMLDCRARTLEATQVGSGATLTFTRTYLGSGQDYQERAHTASTYGGQGVQMKGDVYMRTVRYVKGLCRTEHFTVLDQRQLPVTGAFPEFEVRHQYTFYSAKHARHFKP